MGGKRKWDAEYRKEYLKQYWKENRERLLK